jgi:hypothetical protein
METCCMYLVLRARTSLHPMISMDDAQLGFLHNVTQRVQPESSAQPEREDRFHRAAPHARSRQSSVGLPHFGANPLDGRAPIDGVRGGGWVDRRAELVARVA